MAPHWRAIRPRRKIVVPKIFRVLLTASVLSVALAVPATAEAWESAGCTPGFWKNHTEAWQGYTTDQTIGSVFTSAPEPYASMTLLDGLSLQGGSGVAGASEILLRASIAMVLNEYPDYPSSKIARTNTALESGKRGMIIRLAERWDTLNNGDCTRD